jgi:hypothetical protein
MRCRKNCCGKRVLAVEFRTEAKPARASNRLGSMPQHTRLPMATHYISRLQDGKYKVVREKPAGGVTNAIVMTRVVLESYLKDGHSNPGPLDVLTALDRGESLAIWMDD